MDIIRHIRIHIIFLLSILGYNSSAQNFNDKPKTSLDSIRVKGNRFVFIYDDVYYAVNDTVFIIPDSVDFYVRKNNIKRTDDFYNDVEKKMSKRRVSSLMFDYLFRNKHKNEPHDESSSAQRFTAYEKKAISSIQYTYLNPFGSNINDTTVNNPTKWTKPLNNTHIHTRKWVVRKNLLFEEKEHVNPEALIDTERLLRRLDYVQDARISLDKSTSSTVDIAVAVKDVFPYNFKLNPSNENNARYGISNINIAGIGHELEFDKIKGGGSEFFYRVRNIEGTFIDSELHYANHFSKTGYGLYLSKLFLTQETKYAGGISYSKYDFQELKIDPITELSSTLTYDKKHSDVWLARSIPIPFKSNFLALTKHTNAVLSARVSSEYYTDRPSVTAETNYRFHRKTDYLLGIGLSSRVYYKDKYILQFGRTEDIPTGGILGIIIGHQSGEFTDRKYLGFNYARGGYINRFGYLNAFLSVGSFINKDEYGDGVFKIGADYFTKLFVINQFKFRQFVNFSYAKALNPSEETLLLSQTDLGVRGLSNVNLGTTSHFNIKAESLLFTPINYVGIKLAVFAFIDYTLSTNGENDLIDTEGFAGMGGGIRLRNDNLAISTLQIRLGYYPQAPIYATHHLLQVATSTSLRIRDFDFKAPEIVSFK